MLIETRLRKPYTSKLNGGFFCMYILCFIYCNRWSIYWQEVVDSVSYIYHNKFISYLV